MKKPERVEAGQWWGDTREPGCFRVEGIINKLDEDWALYGDGKFVASCGLLLKMSTSVYLGSGPNPEPSEWMIETLAEHLYAVTVAGITDDPMTNGDRDEAQRDVRAILADRPTLGTIEGKAAALSLYRILRSLGKW